MYNTCIKLLKSRGVELEDIAECVKILQEAYHPDLEIESILEDIKVVLSKREVQHAILTGINLDILAETNSLVTPELNRILQEDYLEEYKCQEKHSREIQKI